jgi:hypothetical protein
MANLVGSKRSMLVFRWRAWSHGEAELAVSRSIYSNCGALLLSSCSGTSLSGVTIFRPGKWFYERRTGQSVLDILSGRIDGKENQPRGRDVPASFLCLPEETVSSSRKHVSGMMAERALNNDDVGIHNLADEKSEEIVVPSSTVDRPIDHGISRDFKHISVVACISPTRESLITYIVTSRRVISRSIWLSSW